MYLKKSPFSVACCMILPLETLPTPEIRVGKRFTSGFFCLQTKHLALWVFLNMGFHGEALLAPRPTPKLEDHPLSAVRDCLFNLFAATLHIGGRSSIHNVRTSHAVVTGTHFSHGCLGMCPLCIKIVQLPLCSRVWALCERLVLCLCMQSVWHHINLCCFSPLLHSSYKFALTHRLNHFPYHMQHSLKVLPALNCSVDFSNEICLEMLFSRKASSDSVSLVIKSVLNMECF